MQREAHRPAPRLNILVLDGLRAAHVRIAPGCVEFLEGAPCGVGARGTRRLLENLRRSPGLSLSGSVVLPARSAGLQLSVEPEFVSGVGAEGVEPSKGKKCRVVFRKAMVALRSHRRPVAL